MKAFTWVTLLVLTVLALGGIFQIPLVQDLVTATGYSLAEVFSGMAAILVFFYVMLAIFAVR
jgi:hypothetical protein